jgi:hypothetical protein
MNECEKVGGVILLQSNSMKTSSSKTAQASLLALTLAGSMFLPGCQTKDAPEDTPVLDETSPTTIEDLSVPEYQQDSTSAVRVEPKVKPSTETSTETPVVSDPVSEPVVTSSNVYANGSYSQSGTYNSPAGVESLTVNLTIADDIVTGVSVTPNSKDETSVAYIKMFASGISSTVIGKPVEGIGQVGAVNGSSLTGAGFNKAMAGILAQAKA